MAVTLTPEREELVRQKVQTGLFPSPEALVNAAVAQVVQADDFSHGELDALLAIGEADAQDGHLADGEEAFDQIKRHAAARRRKS